MLARLRAGGYTFLCSVHGVDYYPHEPRLGVVYELLDMTRVDRITVKARVATDQPHLPSVTPEDEHGAGWPTANHQEREVYDMFGVIFDGHPDMRRILMPEDYEGHPQRRDFPIGGEPIMFTRQRTRQRREPFMSSVENPSLSDYRRREESITLAPARISSRRPAARTRRSQQLLTLNFGPHHPATHGVLRLLVTLQGEIVRDIKPIIGYVHTGIEKTAEDKAYWKVIPVIERMDYLSYYFNSMAFIGAVETLLEVRGADSARSTCA